MFKTRISPQRLLAFLAIFVSCSQLTAQQLDLSDFCFAGQQVVEINNKLFTDIARTFKADSQTVLQSSFNSSCVRVASIRKLAHTPEYQEMRGDVKKLVDPLVNAYDSMIDQYAHFFYNVGKAGQHAAIREAWPIVEMVVNQWEDGGYKDLYEDWESKRELAINQIKQFINDMTDVQRNLELPNAKQLMSSNRLRPQALALEEHWPMVDGDLELWKLNEAYKLSFMDASCKLTSKALAEFQKLDQFVQKIGRYPNYLQTIDTLFDGWDTLLDPIEQRANLVLRYSDDHFAQDNLNAYFREACEDAAEEILRNLPRLTSEVSVGSRVLDKASSLASNSDFKSLAMKSSPVTRGFDGSQRKTVEEAFHDIAQTVRKTYLQIALDSKQSTDPIKAYCAVAYEAMLKNQQRFRNASQRLNFLGMNIFRPECLSALKACKELTFISKLNELDKIPPMTRNILKPGLEAYDKAIQEHANLMLKFVPLLEDKKFMAAKQELANLAVHQPQNLESSFAKIESYAKSMQRIYDDFKKDMQEIKQKNGGKYGDMPRYSSDNQVGTIVTKYKKYPVSKSIMDEFDIHKLYNIPWCNQKLIMPSYVAKDIEDLDLFSSHLRAPAEQIKLCIENFKKFISLTKDYNGKDAAALAFLKNPQVIDFMTPKFMSFANSTLADYAKYRTGIINDAERFGIKEVERLSSISSKSCVTTLDKKQGPLYTFPSGQRHKSIADTFNAFKDLMKKTWNDNTR